MTKELKKCKRAITLLVVLTMVLGLMPPVQLSGWRPVETAEASEGYQYIDSVRYCYNTETKECYVADINCSSGLSFFTIPSTVSIYGVDYTVTAVGSGGCTAISSSSGDNIVIILPHTITEIRDYAFSGCTGLLQISIESNSTPQLKSICNSAFSGCTDLLHIDLPKGLESIGDSAFSGCRCLAGISLPDSLKSIGAGAFYQINTSSRGDKSGALPAEISLTIPEGTSTIGAGAFAGSNVSLAVAEGNTSYSTDKQGILYDYDQKTVLAGTNQTSVELPESVMTIATSAFSGCRSLKKITFQEGVTSIGSYAFASCTALTGIAWPQSVQNICKCAFYGCSNLEKVTLLEGLQCIGDNAFDGTKVSVVLVPSTVQYLSNAAFRNCTELQKVVVDEGNTTYFSEKDGIVYQIAGTKPYYDGHYYPASDTCAYLAPEAIQTATIAASATAINSYAFYNCSNLRNVVLPQGMKTVQYDAFRNCDKIRNLVSYSDDVGFISNWMYYESRDDYRTSYINEKSHRSITYYGNAGSGFQEYVNSIGQEFLPIEKYQEGYPYIDKRGLEYEYYPSTEECSVRAYDNSSASKVIIPESIYVDGAEYAVTSLKGSPLYRYGCYEKTTSGEYLWGNMNRFKSITLPSKLKRLGDYALYGCEVITSLSLPEGLQEIGSHALEGCNLITELELPSGMIYIGDYAFSGCITLEQITIPESVTRIDGSVLDRTDGTKTWKEWSIFYGCDANLIVYCYKGSLAEDFAKKSDMIYYTLGTVPEPTENPVASSLPEATPFATLGIEPEVSPEVTPDITPGTEPKGTPDTTPGATPDTTPGTKPEGTPDTTPGATPDTTPGTKPEGTPEATPLESPAAPEKSPIVSSSPAPSQRPADSDSIADKPQSDGSVATVSVNSVQIAGGYRYRVTAADNNIKTVTLLAPEKKTVQKVAVSKSVSINGDKYTVTAVADNAFRNCKNLQSVTVGGEVISIGKYAFYGCTSLQTVTISGKVKTIGNCAFYGCQKLRKVNLTSTSIKKIGTKAFKGHKKKIQFRMPASRKKTYQKLLKGKY